MAREVERLLEQEGELAGPDLLVFEVLAVLRLQPPESLPTPAPRYCYLLSS